MQKRLGIEMSNIDKAGLPQAAREKIANGGLMTIGEVAALMDVTPATVHRLPLAGIRLGRSLRFDPQDVCRLIDACREPVIA